MMAVAIAYEWDVAISFAGADREIARAIVASLKEHGLRVFFDEHAYQQTVGRNLLKNLRHIYRSTSRLCIILISRHYSTGRWTRWELTSALERLLDEEGYLIPIRIDDTPIDDLPESLGWLPNTSPSVIADLVAERLSAMPLYSQEKDHLNVRSGVENSINMPVDQRLPEDRAADVADALERGFRRVEHHRITEITDPDLVQRCRSLEVGTDLWTTVRLAQDLARYMSWRHKAYLGPIYRCWRDMDLLFLATLPGVISPGQKTLEFELRERGPVLTAEWTNNADKWAPIGYEEFHAGVEGLMADRSGCSLGREAVILALKKRGAEFSFPIGPGPSATAEELCGWRKEQPRLSAFDWDRNPHLTDPSIGVWVEAHHVPTGAVVLVFVFQGGWPNAALYDFRDALSTLLPERTDIYILRAGAVRVSVYLCSSDPLGWASQEALHVADLSASFTYAAIARAVAARRNLPIPPVAPNSGLPELTGNERRAFAVALSTLADAEYPEATDDTQRDYDKDVWLKPRQSLGAQSNLTSGINFGEIVSNADLVAYIGDCENRIH